MKRITISLPDELAQALAREALRLRQSVSAVARRGLAEHLELAPDRRRTLPFAGVGHSRAGHVARDAEEILEREWRADRDR